MPSVLLAARAELRRRGGSLVWLALLTALVVLVVLSSAAGAHRSATSLDRFLVATSSRDADAYANDSVTPSALAELRAVRGVEGAGVTYVYPVQGRTFYDLVVAASPDGSTFRTIDRPVVVAGRMPAPGAPDEVVVTEGTANVLGAAEGSHLRLPTAVPSEWDTFKQGSAGFPGFHGPVLDLTVVGVVRIGDELQGSTKAATPLVIGTPAFVSTYGGRIAQESTSLPLRLSPTASLPAVEESIRRLGIGQAYGGTQVASVDEEWVADTRSAVDVVATALSVFAGIALLAGLIAVGQGVLRQVASSSDAVPITRAIGMTRRQRALVLSLPSVLALCLGTAVGALGAVLASALFPVAIARRAEPSPGIRFDPLVVLGGGALMVVAMTAWTLTVARRRAGVGVAADAARSGAAGRMIPLGPGAGLPARLGARLALDRDRSERRIPTRTAIGGASVAVIGVVAVLVFVSSLFTTIDRQDRWGWTWSAMPDVSAPGDHAALLSALRTTPDLSAASVLFTGDLKLDGRFVNVQTFDAVRGSIAPTVIAGRLPSGSTEVALGGNVMRGLGVRIGDSVRGAGADGSLPTSAGTVRPTDLTVVGQVVVPLIQNQDPGTGAVLTPDGFAHFVGLAGADGLLAAGGQGNVGVNLLVRYPPGSNAAAVERRLEQHLGFAYSGYARPDPPGRLTNLRNITPIAVALAVFFGLLGLAGLVHALTVSVRRRRPDFAILQAFGMERPQLRGLVRSQSVTVMVVALIVGVPLGIVAGRATWKASIATLGIVDTATVPPGQLAALAVAALVVAVVAAVVPGHLVVSGGPARVLRSE